MKNRKILMSVSAVLVLFFVLFIRTFCFSGGFNSTEESIESSVANWREETEKLGGVSDIDRRVRKTIFKAIQAKENRRYDPGGYEECIEDLTRILIDIPPEEFLNFVSRIGFSRRSHELSFLVNQYSKSWVDLDIDRFASWLRVGECPYYYGPVAEIGKINFELADSVLGEIAGLIDSSDFQRAAMELLVVGSREFNPAEFSEKVSDSSIDDSAFYASALSGLRMNYSYNDYDCAEIMEALIIFPLDKISLEDSGHDLVGIGENLAMGGASWEEFAYGFDDESGDWGGYVVAGWAKIRSKGGDMTKEEKLWIDSWLGSRDQ